MVTMCILLYPVGLRPDAINSTAAEGAPCRRRLSAVQLPRACVRNLADCPSCHERSSIDVQQVLIGSAGVYRRACRAILHCLLQRRRHA